MKTTMSILLIALLFVIGCGGGSTSVDTSTTNNTSIGFSETQIDSVSTNGNTQVDFGKEIGIVGEDLTTPEATLEKISQVEEFSKVDLPWLNAKWASFSVPGMGVQDRFLEFKSDGTYTYKDITYRSRERSISSGTYQVYAHKTSPWYYLFLVSDVSKVIVSYIIEKDSNDSFRLINKSKKPAFSSNFLYTRISTATPAVYPGMSFLGTYQYVDYTDILGGSSDNIYLYHFQADNTVVKDHYIAQGILDYKLDSNQSGTWHINEDTYQLEMEFNGSREAYTIEVEFKHEGPYISVLKEGDTDTITWQKTKSIPVVTGEDPFVGEYRDYNDQSYITIKKINDKYLVDINYTFLQTTDIEAHLNADGNLEMEAPTLYALGGRTLIFRAGYNRLEVIKDEDTAISQMEYIEKTSKYILPKENDSILGGWNTRNYATDDYVDIQYYMHDGTYYATDFSGSIVYGTYTFENSKIIARRTCKEPSVRDVTLGGLLMKNILDYYPIVGIQSFGESGSKIESILFQHQLDIYQTKNDVKLKPHPDFPNAYLFTQHREFNDVYNYFKLNADGTGTFFAGSQLWYEEDFTGIWNQEINSHLFNIKYMVAFENGKEYLIYYYDGISVNYSGYNSQTTVLDYTETLEDAKKVELFHGRTALCYKIGDQNRDDGIVLPLNTKKNE